MNKEHLSDIIVGILSISCFAWLVCALCWDYVDISGYFIKKKVDKVLASSEKYTYYGKEYIRKTEEGNDVILLAYDDPVVYNFNTGIYHEPSCEWAMQCVESCIYMERKEAEHFGRHCYVCQVQKHENEYPEDYDKYGDADPDRNYSVPARFD